MQYLSNIQLFLKYAFMCTKNFSVYYSLLNQSFTFFTPIKLHTLKKKKLQIHNNPNSNNNKYNN